MSSPFALHREQPVKYSFFTIDNKPRGEFETYQAAHNTAEGLLGRKAWWYVDTLSKR